MQSSLWCLMKKLLAFTFLCALAAAGRAAITVRLADYGGVPGCSLQELRGSFSMAFSALKAAGGGELIIDPGEYDLDALGGFAAAFQVYDLRDTTILGYGARFKMRTVSIQDVNMPTFFWFQNPQNVTVKGLSFIDTGTNLAINWHGAVCLAVGASEPHSGFRTFDCTADNVVMFFGVNENGTTRYNFQNIDIRATVRNSYYGVNASYTGSYSRAELDCTNVRRAVIVYSVRNWDFIVRGHSDGVAYGSNGFVELALDYGNVSNVNVHLTMTGNISNYYGMVHLYNQGPTTSNVSTQNVNCTVDYNNVTTGGCNMYILDHEYPAFTILPASPRTYRRVYLGGSVNGGNFTGKIIHHPTISTGLNNGIYVSRNLAAMQQNLFGLPRYFHIAR